MEECLVYFRQAINNPLSVEPWSQWWAANESLVQAAFPLMDFVRLKHRRLLGARQILERLGEIEENSHLPSDARSCAYCGERTEHEGGGFFRCRHCDNTVHYNFK